MSRLVSLKSLDDIGQKYAGLPYSVFVDDVFNGTIKSEVIFCKNTNYIQISPYFLEVSKDNKILGINTEIDIKTNEYTKIKNIEVLDENSIIKNIRASSRVMLSKFYKGRKAFIKQIGEVSLAFGFKKLKESFIEKELILYNIKEVFCNKLQKVVPIAEVIFPNGKALKLGLEDVHVYIPITKGYNPPKNREFKIGDFIKCIDNRGLGLKRGELVKIEYIHKTNKEGKVRGSIFSKFSIVEYSRDNNERGKAYLKNFKII
jgi:hypothetical protein